MVPAGGPSYSHGLTCGRFSMELTDWIVILAVALIAIAFRCARTPPAGLVKTVRGASPARGCWCWQPARSGRLC